MRRSHVTATTRSKEAPIETSTLPRRVEGRSVWTGPQLAKSDDWKIELSAAEVNEIRAAIDHAIAEASPIATLTRDDFPLPGLAPRLVAVLEELIHGRGLVLLRGLPVERYTTREVAILFCGLGTYLGRAVPQNAQGHLLGHVRDIGLDPLNPTHRIYGTRARQPYHTDSTDIVGLLCLRQARSGGASSVVSSPAIYNEMMARRPDLVEVMAEGFYVDRKGEIPPGKDAVYEMAVFHHYAGLLTTIYARDFIEAAQRFDEVPRLTARQIEAMDLMDSLAASEELRLDMVLEPGDVQLLHNHVALHSRTAYEDHADPELKRHLLRLWLSPPGGRLLPPVFAERYGTVEPGLRGGIRVEGVEPHVPLTAEA